MKTRVAMIVAAILIVWLGASLVRVENQRYALLGGMCRDASGAVDGACLQKVETRTAWWWHLLYALRG